MTTFTCAKASFIYAIRKMFFLNKQHWFIWSILEAVLEENTQ
ncbi:hypothetical protein SAMN02745127_02399 [Oceanospirillum multiglobuliferum]|nr:hypothetical protein SAMN02745127_02399 [Oceanospirillum multiglobuliferum]